MINNSSTWSLEKISEMNIDEIDYHFNNIFKSVILGTKFSSKLLAIPDQSSTLVLFWFIANEEW